MKNFENLPQEMIINILSRLPPESVFQFLCVSKFWYALINDPTNSSLLQHKHILFMRLQKSTDLGKTQLVLSDLVVDQSMSHFNDFLLPLPFDWNDRSQWPDHILPFPFGDDIDFYEGFHIHDHSHGLVCLTDYRTSIILCNPTTREFRKLPPSIIMLTEPSRYVFDGCGNAVGFGYDPESRDFKVIRLVCYNVHTIYWRAEVFDLSNNKWREIQVPNIENANVPSFGIYHEGIIFWVITIYKESTSIRAIYSFDMSEEVFDQIRLPESVEEEGFQNLCEIDMGILNGSIIISHYSWQKYKFGELTLKNIWELESTLDIWKMEKNNKSGIILWSKLFTISLNCEIGRPLMFINSNQLLTIKKGQIILYNFKSGQFKELPIKGHAYEDGYFIKYLIRENVSCEATHFVKSLYSLKGEKNIK